MRDFQSLIRVWVVPFLALGCAFVVLFVVFFLLDYALYGEPGSFWAIVLETLGWYEDKNSASPAAIDPIPEVVAGVLGIAITVVAIIVELAANRYTSRVVDLFVADRTNLLVMGLFVVSCVFTLWVVKTDTAMFTPHLGFAMSLILMTVSLLILVPYFNHIFEFLDPKNIIAKIRNQISYQIRREVQTKEEDPEKLFIVKHEVARAAEQISDIALNSIHQQDRTLAMDCVVTLKLVINDYLEVKDDLPEAWFLVSRDGGDERADPDYVSLSEEGIREIETTHCWLEHKIFKQMHLVFGTSLNNLRDLNNLIGMSLRDVAFKAIEVEDRRVRWLAIKFFNTLFRTTINNRDVRTAYNLFAQYRLLGERLLEVNQLFIVEQIFNYFKYYGQLADSMGIGFLLETVAYDLYRLCRLAHEREARNFDALLRIFLDVDRPPDLLEKEDHLLGVRKAQVMLGSYFVATENDELAQRIIDDVRNEPLPRLRTIKADILRAERNFWEITDRGTNFDYLEPEYRLGFHQFFERLEQAVIDYHRQRKAARAAALTSVPGGPGRGKRKRLSSSAGLGFKGDLKKGEASSGEVKGVTPSGSKKTKEKTGPRTSEEVMAEVARLRQRMDRGQSLSKEIDAAGKKKAAETKKADGAKADGAAKTPAKKKPRTSEEVMAEVARLRKRMQSGERLSKDAPAKKGEGNGASGDDAKKKGGDGDVSGAG